MSLFKKKNKEDKEPKKYFDDYKSWENDFGFLKLILTRKEEITKTYLIGLYDQQLSSKEYIRDEDIDPIVKKGVTEVMTQIGSNYKNFLIEKYFGSEENLVIYITEEYYMELISNSIMKNYDKAKRGAQLSSVMKLNSKLNNSEK